MLNFSFPALIALTACAPQIALAQSETKALQIGATAPRIQSVNQRGETVDLGQLYDAGTVLIYFYPKAGTPGCTAQACSLRDSYEQLQQRGVTVIGVSLDGVEAQANFTSKEKLPFILLADEQGQVVDAFGVDRQRGVASRQAFLVQNGVVVWRDLQASTAEQAADVLAALDQITAAAAATHSSAPPAEKD